MPDSNVGVPKSEKPVIRKLEQRVVFVSHTHADRKLAAVLETLIEEAFSGLVRAFVSSDPAPTGGLQPGSEWYSDIHSELSIAESVWVLATPTSIQRPWIYWEAGVGKVTCPGAVVVLRVDLPIGDLPSPLSNFQSYDGLEAGDGGIGELLGKVAHQIGMKVHPMLIGPLAEKWAAAAKKHKPEPTGEGGPTLSQEQLGQAGALIARLEALVASIPAMPSQRQPATSARRRQAEAVLQLRQRVLGHSDQMFSSVDAFAGMIDEAPADTTFSFLRIDDDEDAMIVATRGNERDYAWLLESALPNLEDFSGGSERTKSLLQEILTAVREGEKS